MFLVSEYTLIMTAGVAEWLRTRSMLGEGGDDDHVLINRRQLFISTDVLGFSIYPIYYLGDGGG